MTPLRFPRFAEWLLRRTIADRTAREGVIGDLREEHAAFVARRWRFAGAVRYTTIALLMALRYSTDRFQTSHRWPAASRARKTAIATRMAVAASSVLQDLRYGARTLSRRPGFAIVAVTTLAIGVGTNTAMFGVLYGVLLKPLAYDEPDRLVAVWGTSVEVGQARDVVSGPNFLDFKAQNVTFERMAAYRSGGGTLLVDGAPVYADGIRVSPDFFPTLGARPAMGRLFHREDGRGATDVVVISHRLWQQHYGGDPNIVGRRIQRIGRSHTVIGVLAEDFGFALATDLVEPLDLDYLRRRNRSEIDYWIIGRLPPGVTPAQARSDLDGILREIAQDDRRMEPWSVTVDPWQAIMFEYVRPALVVLWGAVSLTLLIACANVANLVLARGVGRTRELAVRTSLGAPRRRLFFQLLSEAVILGVGGGAFGTALSVWAISLMPSLLPAVVPIPGSAAVVRVPEISASPAVLFYGVAVGLATVTVFGLVPALQISRQGLARALREATGGVAAGRRVGRVQRSIVVAELALASLMLTATGLAIRSTLRLLDVDPGLDPQPVVTMYFGELDRRGTQERSRYYARVLDAAAAVPGVASVGLNDYLPFQQEDDFEAFHVEDRPRPDPSWRVEWRRVSADYFRTVGVPLQAGRMFAEADDEDAPSVVIINNAMAKKYWPNEHPVGQRIVVYEDAYGSSEIVGVVGDVRRRGLDREAPAVMYVPYHRSPRPVVGLFARVEGTPATLAAPIAEAVRSVDPQQPIGEVRTLAEIVDRSTATQKLMLQLVSLVAFLAVVLAAVGVYGVMSYWTRQMAKETSVRVALGAGRLQVLRTVLGNGISLTLLGLPLGLAAGALLTRGFATLMYGVEVADPLPYAFAAAVILCAASAACALPALRAARIDPMHALRAE